MSSGSIDKNSAYTVSGTVKLALERFCSSNATYWSPRVIAEVNVLYENGVLAVVASIDMISKPCQLIASRDLVNVCFSLWFCHSASIPSVGISFGQIDLESLFTFCIITDREITKIVAVAFGKSNHVICTIGAGVFAIAFRCEFLTIK